MATPFRYTVILGGVVVAYAWSLHAANQKLTTAALKHAAYGGVFPVSGEVRRDGLSIVSRHFTEGFSSAPTYHQGAL